MPSPRRLVCILPAPPGMRAWFYDPPSGSVAGVELGGEELYSRPLMGFAVYADQFEEDGASVEEARYFPLVYEVDDEVTELDYRDRQAPQFMGCYEGAAPIDLETARQRYAFRKSLQKP